MAADLERLVVSLEANIKKYERELARSRGVTDSALRDVERSVTASAGRIEAAMARVGASIRAGIAGALAGISIGNFAQLSDAFTKIQNQLKVGGLQGDKLTNTYQALFEIAQKQGAPLEELATLYGRASSAQKELNASSDELLRFTNATALALRVGGTSAQEASGALLQLSQALGGGKIQAEEYNSLIDGLRPLLQAAAAGIEEAGGSVSKLTALVKDGKVSSEAFFRGVLAGTPAIEALSATTKDTTSQALTRLNNALIDLVGRFNQTSGASDNAIVTLNNFTAAVEAIGKAIPGTMELLKGLIDRMQAAATGFGNLPTFKSLAEKYADPKAVAALEEDMNAATGSGQSIAASLSEAKKTGGIEGIDKLRDAFKSRTPADAKKAKDVSGAGNMFDQVAEIDRKALTPKTISLKDYAVKDDKEKKERGGKEKLDEYEREVAAIEKRTRAFDNERASLGKSATEVAKAEASFRLMEAAKKANVPVTDELRAKVETLATAYAKAKVQLDEAEEAQRRAAEAQRYFGSAMTDALSDLAIEGRSVTEVFENLTKSITKAALQAALMGTGPLAGLFGTPANANGSGGGILGSLLSGLTQNPTGRADGGSVYPGRAYTVGESGRETFVPTTPGRIIPARRQGAVMPQIIDQRSLSAPPMETRRGPGGNPQIVVRDAYNSMQGEARRRGQLGPGYRIG
ncbi:tape measure protein [Methylorubrum populi]